MSRDLNEAPTEREVGGIVTTVKAEESGDLDFQARLKQLRLEAGETVEEPKPKEGEEAKPKEGEEAKPKEGEEPKPKNWQEDLSPEARREVNKLYKDLKGNKREIRELSEKMDRILAQKADNTAGPAAPAAQVLKRPIKPDPLTFTGTPAEFAKAEEDYEDKLYTYRKTIEDQTEAEERQREADKIVIANFNQAATDFAKENSDYVETMDEASNDVDDEMFGAIIQTGPMLGYHWAKNPEESAKIARMPSGINKTKAILKTVIMLETAAEEAKKKKKDEPKPKTGSEKQEPKPLNPPAQVKGGPVAQAKDRSKMTFKEKEREYAKAHPGALNYEP